MGVSKEDRKSYEDGEKEANYIRDHPIDNLFTGGIHNRPSDPSRGAAFDKGIRRESLDEDSGSGGSSDSGACCYITTACLDAMDLPIDSLEMKAMKTLTKEHILKSFSGKRDYILYGRKAPNVVQAIRARSDSHEIWERVYETLREITSTVFSRDYGKAHQQYRDLVLGLESKYA